MGKGTGIQTVIKRPVIRCPLPQTPSPASPLLREKCYLCVRYEVLPMSRAAQTYGRFPSILSPWLTWRKYDSLRAVIQERRYLNNVSARSIEWYGFAFKWLQSENPTQSDLKQTVIKMREHGL